MKRLSTDRLLTMGLALYADKRTMEQRVRGIFGRRRTAAFARALSAILALLVCIGGFTTACLPVRGEAVTTHENELALAPVPHASAVDETAPENAPLQTVAQTGYAAPARWEGETQGDAYRIVYDAEVTVPQDMILGESRCRRTDFSQAQIDEIVRYLTGDAKLYVWPKQKDKADYAAEIAEAEKGTLVDGAYAVTDDSRRLVRELTQLQAAAPDTVARSYTTAQPDYGYDLDGTRHTDVKCVVSVGVDAGNHEDAAIVVSNGVIRDATYTWMYYAKGRLLDAFTVEMNGDPRDPNPKYAEWMRMIAGQETDSASAEARAEQVLRDLGIDGMAHIDTEDCILATWQNEGGLSARETDAAAKLVTFVPRTAVGIVRPLPYPYAYSGSRKALPGKAGAVPADTAYGLRELAAIRIAIGDNGIEYFDWSMPAQANPDARACPALLPFSQVQARIDATLQSDIAPDAIPDAPNASFFTNITVRSVELRLYPVLEDASVVNYTVAPVWRVTYDVRDDLTFADGRETRQGNPITEPSLLFSAVDGRLIAVK